MAKTASISTALKRKLKDGKEYESLIPRVSCERTDLGEGDTFHTVEEMKDWIEKYSFQTEKLAPRLQGSTLGETVSNIYKFLYSHIQYQADGALQQLRSPACTWKQRRSGVDCKSFSIFGSSLLNNLGISHFIRQIKQPGYYPDQFTHVYIVIPQDQTKIHSSATFVLDPTKHENVESIYSQKEDLLMKHVGLNAPQDGRAAQMVRNFENFTQFLLDKGASLESVNAIRTRISQFTEKGRDPEIKVTYEGLQVQGQTIPLQFKEHIPFLKVQQALTGGPKGLGFSAAFGGGNRGLGFSFSDAFGDLVFEADKQLTDAGVDTSGGIIDAGVSIATSFLPLGNILDGLLGELNLAENISNVLKYGLSSWGASATPEEMKKRFAENCYPWLQQEIASITMENIAKKLTAIDVNLRGNQEQFKMLKQNHSNAKSTRLANEWAEQECGRLLTKTLDSLSAMLQAEGVSVSAQNVSASSSALQPYKIWSFWSKDDIPFDRRYVSKISYIIYKVSQESLTAWMKRQVQNATGGSGSGSGSGSGEGKEGSNTGLIIGGTALAALPLFFMLKKKKK